MAAESTGFRSIGFRINKLLNCLKGEMVIEEAEIE